MVALAALIAGQNPLSENRRASTALPPVTSVPVSAIWIALKWKSGNGVHTMSSARRFQVCMFASAIAHAVRVTQHAALRRASGTAGVHECGEVHRTRHHGRTRVVIGDDGVVVVPGHVLRARQGFPHADDVFQFRYVLEHSGRTVGEIALHEEDARRGVGELVREVHALVRGVHRHRDRTQFQRGEPRRDSGRRILEERGDPISFAHAEARPDHGRAGCCTRRARRRSMRFRRRRDRGRRDRIRAARRAARSSSVAANRPRGSDSLSALGASSTARSLRAGIPDPRPFARVHRGARPPLRCEPGYPARGHSAQAHCSSSASTSAVCSPTAGAWRIVTSSSKVTAGPGWITSPNCGWTSRTR